MLAMNLCVVTFSFIIITYYLYNIIIYNIICKTSHTKTSVVHKTQLTYFLTQFTYFDIYKICIYKISYAYAMWNYVHITRTHIM